MSYPIDLYQGTASDLILQLWVTGGKAMKQDYRVSFFKKLVDSTGHPVNACQGVVQVQAVNPESAVNAAKRMFAEFKDVRDWSLRADYEVLELLPVTQQKSRNAPVRASHGSLVTNSGAPVLNLRRMSGIGG
jgi:hypothetical protein